MQKGPETHVIGQYAVDFLAELDGWSPFRSDGQAHNEDQQLAQQEQQRGQAVQASGQKGIYELAGRLIEKVVREQIHAQEERGEKAKPLSENEIKPLRPKLRQLDRQAPEENIFPENDFVQLYMAKQTEIFERRTKGNRQLNEIILEMIKEQQEGSVLDQNAIEAKWPQFEQEYKYADVLPVDKSKFVKRYQDLQLRNQSQKRKPEPEEVPRKEQKV